MELDTLIQSRRVNRTSRGALAAVVGVLLVCLLLVAAIVLVPFNGSVPAIGPANATAKAKPATIPAMPRQIPATLVVQYDKYDDLTMFAATIPTDRGELYLSTYEDGNVTRYRRPVDGFMIALEDADSRDLVFLADGVRIASKDGLFNSCRNITTNDLLTLANARTITFRLDGTEHVVSKEGVDTFRALAAHMVP